MTIIKSTLSKRFSQKSMAVAKCSGVPVPIISIGLPTAAPGYSLDFSSSAIGPSKLGTFKRPLDKASASITAGPPACVTIAQFFPFTSFKVKILATVVNSSRLKQRTIPALRNKASTAESELAIAPVCEEAARFPDSVLPALIAAILHPLRIKEDA